MNDSAIEIKRYRGQKTLINCVGFWVVAALLQQFNFNDWASLDVGKTLSGEAWRLITGHILHADWQHYVMNMIGLSLCMATFYKDVAVRHWLCSFIFISLFSSLGLLGIYTEDQRYVGFSDVLHGWILFGAIAIVQKEVKLTTAIFILFWLKILEENLELAFFTSYGVSGNVAKESHILGALGGIFYGLIFLPNSRTFITQKLFPWHKKSEA